MYEFKMITFETKMLLKIHEINAFHRQKIIPKVCIDKLVILNYK